MLSQVKTRLKRPSNVSGWKASPVNEQCIILTLELSQHDESNG